MNVTPADLAKLALERHRLPWNWSLQFAALILFCLTLLFHSPLFLTATIILCATGFLSLNMDEPPDNRWFRFVKAGIEWEKDWIAAPWNWAKWTKFIFIFIITIVFLWALWTREAATLGLILGFAVLIRVVVENMKNGIEP
ncbi:hypothetical protein [uncultured Pseudodesulfovibrio sp.]|uniref:hypothetical protein n=1 Tax=uncultured Pseudodesulfovibrio sp. TaxID=2035858 RepID=UPI0029C67928|nr:hypothetical protein [uncultured Pseudodesulfovibrio sp.]